MGPGSLPRVLGWGDICGSSLASTGEDWGISLSMASTEVSALGN